VTFPNSCLNCESALVGRVIPMNINNIQHFGDMNPFLDILFHKVADFNDQ
jgi:hypothetical protein